jgi:hypothetical protein
MNELGTLIVSSDINPSDESENRVLVSNLKDAIWAILKLDIHAHSNTTMTSGAGG